MPSTPRKRLKWLRIILWSLLGIIAFVVLAVTSLTLYLSGDRLTRIVNQRASEYFNADVRTHQCNFTLWSTFPRFSIDIDSLEIVSRTLRGRLSAKERSQLPAGADSLASLRSVHGGVNVLALLAGKIELHDVVADGLRLNMVVVNDSVNNYNIVPQTDSVPFRMPYISAKSIRLTNMQRIAFLSLPDNLNANADVDSAQLVRRQKTNSYDLLLNGDISARLDSIQLCENLPFRFGGQVDFRFNPFAVILRDMRLGLANLDSRINMGLNLGEKSGIDNFRTEISAFNIMKLLAYLPPQFLPNLKGLTTDLRTRLTIRLTAPYRFSDAGLPSFIAELSVPESSITYTLDTGEKYTLNDITLRAQLNFNGNDWQNSDCVIDQLRARGEGLALLLNGNIAEVFTNPRLAANIHLDLDIPKIAAAIPSIASCNPHGEGEVDMKVDFPVSMLTSVTSAGLPVTGTARLNNVAVNLPDGTKISADRLALNFSNQPTADFNAQADGTVDDVMVTMADGTTVKSPAVTLYANARSTSDYSLSADLPTTAINLPSKKLQADATGVSAAYNGVDLNTSIRQLALKSVPLTLAASKLQATVNPAAENTAINLKVANAEAKLSGNKKINVTNLDVQASGITDIHASSGKLIYSMPDFEAPGRQFLADAYRWNGAVRLSPDFKLRHVSLNLPLAHVSTAVYDAPVTITNLRADMAGLDSITLHSLNLRSQMTGVSIMGGLLMTTGQDGLTYYSGHTTIHFDTLHFNQIARTIEHGSLYHGNRPGVDPKDASATPRQYNAMMVSPRFNVSADLTADATVYTNLWLTDLGARLSMQPGRLAIDTLYLSANFGHAQAAVEYLTPSPENISIGGGFHIQNFNLTKFFDSYPKVLAMMPEMSNLHGNFHADAYVVTGVFPDMSFNTASMLADISASATDMYLHQNPFIRRVARMALIFENGNISIPTIHARARIYDHLLTVEPFDIHLGKYLLQVAGRNDFAGNLYYHVGVLHNPLLPIKFGIDIRGQYGNPKIRFARSSFNEKRSESINGVDAPHHINLIDELHHGGLLLLHHAAKAQVLDSDPTK